MKFFRAYCWGLLALSAAVAGGLVWLCLDRPHAWPLVLLPALVGLAVGRIINLTEEV